MNLDGKSFFITLVYQQDSFQNMKLPPAQVQAAQPEEVALAPPSTARRGQESYNSRFCFRFADPFGQKPLFEPKSTIKKPKFLKNQKLS